MELLKHWIILGSVGILAIFTSSCSSETQSKNVSDEDSTTAVPVEIAVANSGKISAYYSSTATLEADEEATVVAKVRGIVKNIYVEEGDYVQAGKILAQLEDEQLQLEAERAKATMDRLKNELNRKEELFQKKLISAQEFENAKYEYQAQKSAYELADLQIKHSQIRAPISGVISDRMIKVGNMINSDQEVYQITDFNPLLAVLNVPEHEMDKLKKGQPALIQVDAITSQTFEGTVLRISPTVDPETGTFEVTVSIQDESRRLKPGMFGRVQIVYDTRENALMVPKNAVMNEDGTSSVFIINSSLAYRKTIRTGYENGENIEVLEGISPADTVVTIGQSSLQDSSLVEAVSF
ncbi:efflux RND transporter periplasmic adaptor subunit [Fodinibius salsisoli]|uniref:Efflux RND transporter periplasmic adaptor subunit n=1 Tax=Fodinibius salsisoli TaxID=2820877 RepID=A0ABT3PTJ5_9BACT|nr:efflux RND transporter periplasmic adaptor subunit [Fodinibius salsisoli]MCW9709189.1 efflux RND transporter periplasmic adaptor subunit [Fodinibius salsisoli]